MKALITGVGGFVGRHMVRHLRQATNATLIGTTYQPPQSYDSLPDGVDYRQLDITDSNAVSNILSICRPDAIYHLAGQAFVPRSFDAPWETFTVNVRGALNIFRAMLDLDLDARVLVIGSGEEYGRISPEDIPVDETHSLCPNSPYSVSKVSQDLLALQYHLSHGLQTIRARAFNHIGPGQSKRFVAPAFATQIAAIEAGKQEPVVRVGNLEAERDFTDVRDIVRAYHLLIEQGKPGDVYNIGRGEAYSIQHLLDTLLDLSAVDIEVRTDPDRLRPVDTPIVVCDASKLHAATGWQPQIPFKQSLADILDEHRAYKHPT